MMAESRADGGEKVEIAAVMRVIVSLWRRSCLLSAECNGVV